MGLMTWQPQYAIGVELVDGHHQRLFDLVNGFHDALLAGEGRAAVDAALKALLDYTVYHFNAEEELMASVGYPELGAHKVQHQALLDKTLAMVERYRKGEEELSMPLVHFLKDWLYQHTTTSDRKIGQFIRQATGG